MLDRWLRRTFELQDPAHARLLPMEGLRGLAVTLVFLQHAGVQALALGLPPGATRAMAVVCGNYGNLGVELFFLLSGYLIYGTLVRRAPGFASFMARRAWRIYPAFLAVFAPMLALALLAPIPGRLPDGVAGGTLGILANLLFLPGLLPMPAVVTVAWSLSYEVFFYVVTAAVVLGLGMHGMARGRRLAILGAAAAGFVAGCALGPPGFPVRMAPFFAGMALAEGLGRRVPGWLGLAAPVFGCAVVAARVPLGTAGEFLQTACFFALCAVCFRGVGLAARAMAWAPLRWLGNMSYSYYLVHGLVVRVAFVALGRVLPDGLPPWAFWALLAPLFAATLAAGAVLFIAVEKPVSLRPRAPRMEGVRRPAPSPSGKGPG